MKRGIVAAASVLLVSLAQVVLAGPPGKERGKELAALEQKIVGAWKGQTGCSGNFLFRADGTYEVKGYGPGGDDFAGTWKVRWDARNRSRQPVAQTIVSVAIHKFLRGAAGV